MIIVPAIDIIGGKCVRLTKGDYDTVKVYETDPLKMARQFETQGITHLHLVDLDGAKTGEVVNWEVLKILVENTHLHIDFSGGIKTDESVEKALSLGAHQLAIGSVAVKNAKKLQNWLEKYGSEKFILAADVNKGYIATHGWQQNSETKIEDFISYWMALGLKRIMCTDISKDGMLEGPATDLYKRLLSMFSDLELIASGGVSNLEDLHQLKGIGCYSAIVGKAIYENKINLSDLTATI